MKLLLIVALLALFQATRPVPRQATNQPGQESDGNQNKAAPEQAPSSKLQPVQNLANPQPQQQAGPSQAGQNENQPVVVRVLPVNVHKDWADYLYIGTGLILVFVTFGIAIIALIQAKAAMLSAEAVINSQRAWVVASPAELRPPLGFIPEPGDPLMEPGRDMQNIIFVRFKNVGVTPAKVLQTCALYVTVDSLGTLPSEPQYSGIEIHAGLFLFNRKDESGRDEAIGRVAPLWPNRVLTKEQVQAVRAQEIFLYAYGFVGYEDAFKRQHTMRFGYVYNFPKSGQPPLVGFLPAGPSKYNEAD